MRTLLIGLLLIATSLATSGAHSLELKSGPTQATLLELYTSEGCSSCPPADRWYSQLKAHPRLWKDLVPVAFHVDYWNYLGWEDRFAKPEFAMRQRSFKTQGAARAVYTPGMMAKGEEWREWRLGVDRIPRSSQRTGVLTAALEGDRLRANFDALSPELTQAELHIAILGFGLKTPVKAGENRGKSLEHDFVVLGYTRAKGPGPWELKLPNAPYSEQATRLALSAWVSPSGSVTPVQAVGGWLP